MENNIIEVEMVRDSLSASGSMIFKKEGNIIKTINYSHSYKFTFSNSKVETLSFEYGGYPFHTFESLLDVLEEPYKTALLYNLDLAKTKR